MMIVSILDDSVMAGRSCLSSVWRPIAASIGIVSLCVQTGCAVVPSRQLPLPPPDVVRARFGTIGIVSARFTPRPMLQLPAKGGLAGAGRGAANWSAAGGLAPLSGGGGGGNGLGELLLLAASVAGATIGGISGTVAGAVMAEPAEKVQVTETALHDALNALKLQESLRDRMMEVVQEQTREHAVILPDTGPESPAEKTRYAYLADKGIDTVIEVAVTEVGVNGPWDINPPLNFTMKARVRAIRTSVDQEFYASDYEYIWGERTFVEWAADNAEPFRTELNRSCQDLAEKVVEELFLIYLPPVAEEFSPSPMSGYWR